MSTIDTRIRPEVKSILGRLKRGIRLYVAIEGVTLVIVLAAVLFWISFSVDGLWFAASKYELPRWFRYSVDGIAIAIILLGATYWVAMRLFKSIRSKPLALVLERRFPGLNDRLVTSVELRETVTGHETDLTVEMLNRTVDAAAAEARRLKVGDVFETRPVRWACIGALVAIISVIGYGVAYPDDMRRWADAYIYGEEEYWERDTRLTVHVVDSVTSRIREFDDDRVYKHPRGGDLTLLIRVPRRDATGKELVVPDEVYVQYRMGEDSTKDLKAARTSRTSREFRASFGGLREDMTFWVTGNDYKNKTPYTVKLVDPPRVDAVTLHCEYPQYTDLETDKAVEKSRKVGGRQVAVPAETLTLMQVDTNKRLLRARIEYGPYELDFGWMPRKNASGKPVKDARAVRDFSAKLTAKGVNRSQMLQLQSIAGVSLTRPLAKSRITIPIPEQIARSFIVDESKDGPGLRIPFIVSAMKTEAAIARFTPKKRLGEKFAGFTPLVMPPDTEVRIYLEDTDEIGSPDPELLVIQGEPDPPPAIEASRVDIGDAVTPIASIPIVARITDDKYGVKLARLEYRVAPKGRTTTEGQPWKVWDVNGVDDSTPQKYRDINDRWPKDFRFHTLHNGNAVDYEVFECSQIKVDDVDGTGQPVKRPLQPGDRLTIAVYAEDADDINGPNSRRSAQLFDFRIVSPGELDAILFEKESRLRVQFDKIIGEIKATREELVERRLQLAEWERLSAVKPPADKRAEHDATLDRLHKAIELTASRARAQFSKNHNETLGVLAGFRQLRAEIDNNHIGVDTTRMKQEIIDVLHDGTRKVPVDAEIKPIGNFVRVDRALGGYNRAVDEDREFVPTDVSVAINDSIQRTDNLLDRLNTALKGMKELKKITEAIADLHAIIEGEKDLQGKTIDRRNKEILKKLGGSKP